MREWRIVVEDQFVFDLVVKVVEDMIWCYGVDVYDVDMIFVVISMLEYVFFSIVFRVQVCLNIIQIGVLDLSVVCVGFVYGLQLVDSMIISGMYCKVFVIGVEILFKIMDYIDCMICILFGDGVGVFLLE